VVRLKAEGDAVRVGSDLRAAQRLRDSLQRELQDLRKRTLPAAPATLALSYEASRPAPVPRPSIVLSAAAAPLRATTPTAGTVPARSTGTIAASLAATESTLLTEAVERTPPSESGPPDSHRSDSHGGEQPDGEQPTGEVERELRVQLEASHERAALDQKVCARSLLARFASTD
jgi:hypothetical protein